MCGWCCFFCYLCNMNLDFSGLTNSLNNISGTVLQAGLAGKSYKEARKLAEYQYSKAVEMWNLQNDYNSPSSQMARLSSAGLNPNLVYGTGSVVGNTTSDYPKFEAPDTSQYQKVLPPDLNGALSIASNVRLQDAQSSNLEAQTQNTLTRLPLNELELSIKKQHLIQEEFKNAKTKIEKDYWRELYVAELDKLEATTLNLDSHSYLNDSTRFLTDEKRNTEKLSQQSILSQIKLNESTIRRNSVLNKLSIKEIAQLSSIVANYDATTYGKELDNIINEFLIKTGINLRETGNVASIKNAIGIAADFFFGHAAAAADEVNARRKNPIRNRSIKR